MKIIPYFKKIITTENNKYLELLFALIFFLKYIVSAFNLTIRSIFSNTYKIDTLFVYSVFLFVVLISAKSIVKNIKKQQIYFVLFIVLSLFISFLFSNNKEISIEASKVTLFVCLPAFLLSSTISDYEKLWKYMKYGSYFAIISTAYLMFLLQADHLINEGSYSQSNAYSILLPTVVLLVSLFKKIDLKELFVFLLGLFMILMNGARGPLLCIMILLIILIVRSLTKIDKTKKIISVSVIILVLLLGVLLKNIIIDFLYGIYVKLNMSTRILDRLKDNSFFIDNARMDLIKASLDSIKQNFVLGLGVINDRQYLNDRIHLADYAIGSYPHNIILEILMHYGVFIGTAILSALTLMFYKIYQIGRSNIAIMSSYLTFLTVGLMPLFVSSSYINDINFYVLLGFSFSILKNKMIFPYGKINAKKIINPD